MDTVPLISVLINTYNYGRYINQAIDSALAQVFPAGEWEIIVVDDGSTDDTSTRIDEYRDRITYLRKTNGGQASAFNAGVAVARGDIICILDADDYFYPNKLSEVYAEFEKHPDVGIVYNSFDVVNESGDILVEALPPNLKRGDLSGRTLLGFVIGSPSSGISFLRRILIPIEIPEEPFRISADYFYLNILPLVATVGIVNTPLHAYRKHDSNSYLKKSDIDRQEIHAQQKDAVWGYAERELGRKFFSAMHELTVEGRNLTPKARMQIWASGVRYLRQVSAPSSLKLWSLAKMTTRMIVPWQMFLRIRTWRNRVFGQTLHY